MTEKHSLIGLLKDYDLIYEKNGRYYTQTSKDLDITVALSNIIIHMGLES